VKEAFLDDDGVPIKAFTSTRDGSKLSTIELKKFCSENLPLYSQLQLNIYHRFFGVCGVCYAFAVDYRKQTVAMIKQDIKKYYELEGLEGCHRSIWNLHEKNRRRIV
jgi:hypothetical protein